MPTSKQQLVDNWQKNIHLGLDLKGGSQLVLQVQIQDAFKAEAEIQAKRWSRADVLVLGDCFASPQRPGAALKGPSWGRESGTLLRAR